MTVLAILALSPAATPALAGSPSSFPANSGKVVVTTQNLYVGADIFRVFAVPPALIPLEIAAVFQTVLETDYPSRVLFTA